MKVSDLFKVGLFIMALVLTVLFARLINERYEVVHIQKELLQYDRALKIEEVKKKKETVRNKKHRVRTSERKI